jgi:hypothetical protein
MPIIPFMCPRALVVGMPRSEPEMLDTLAAWIEGVV